jgi:hypothetical protein
MVMILVRDNIRDNIYCPTVTAVPLLARDLLYNPACKLAMSFGLLACIVGIIPHWLSGLLLASHTHIAKTGFKSISLPLFLHLCRSHLCHVWERNL